MRNLVPGQVVELTVLEIKGSQWILTDGELEIPLNASESDQHVAVGEKIKVFLYKNRRGILHATTQIPHNIDGEYGWARVIKTTKEGAFVDIGIGKEIIVKGEDLPALKSLWPKTGDYLYVTLRVDKKGELFGRLVTEERVQELFESADEHMHNQNIQARPYRLLPVGSFLLGIEHPYRIFVHHTEMESEPRLGQEVTVRVIGVKEDGSLNASMLPRKHERLSKDAEVIYEYLQSVGGEMPFDDKSTPEEIKEMFQMSKGAFKRALGSLMKAGKVKQQDGWTFLIRHKE